ncbi:MAG: Serine/threonine protein kinase, partial [uncultured Rubrobacteraceae bacterium]
EGTLLRGGGGLPATPGRRGPRARLHRPRAPPPEQLLRRLRRFQRGAGLPLHRQGTQAGPSRTGEDAAGALEGGRAARRAHAPAHRASLREDRRASPRPDRGDPDRRDPRPSRGHEGQPAAPKGDLPPRVAPLLRAPLPPRPGHPPPRPQAVEHRLGEGDGEDTRPQHRPSPRPHEEGGRHDPIHGPRAGPGGPRKPGHGRLGYRRRPLRSRHGRAAVQRRVRGDGLRRGPHGRDRHGRMDLHERDRHGQRPWRPRAAHAPGRPGQGPPARPGGLRRDHSPLPRPRPRRTPHGRRTDGQPARARI